MAELTQDEKAALTYLIKAMAKDLRLLTGKDNPDGLYPHVAAPLQGPCRGALRKLGLDTHGNLRR